MPKQTQQEKLSHGLAVLGHKQVLDARTARFLVFADAYLADRFYYVGKAGSLRVGRNLSASIPHDRLKKAILNDFQDKEI
jgi:hypothetical protein